MDLTVAELWAFLPRGYLLTIAIECLIFRAAYPIPVPPSAAMRDVFAIVAANLSSFLFGLWLFAA